MPLEREDLLDKKYPLLLIYSDTYLLYLLSVEHFLLFGRKDVIVKGGGKGNKVVRGNMNALYIQNCRSCIILYFQNHCIHYIPKVGITMFKSCFFSIVASSDPFIRIGIFAVVIFESNHDHDDNQHSYT